VSVVRAGGTFGVVQVEWNASDNGINHFYFVIESFGQDITLYSCDQDWTIVTA